MSILTLGAISSATYGQWAATTTTPPKRTVTDSDLARQKSWSVAYWVSIMSIAMRNFPRAVPWETAALPNFQAAIRKLTGATTAPAALQSAATGIQSPTPQAIQQAVQQAVTAQAPGLLQQVIPPTPTQQAAAPTYQTAMSSPGGVSTQAILPVQSAPSALPASISDALAKGKAFLSGPNGWMVYAGGGLLVLLLLMRRK